MRWCCSYSPLSSFPSPLHLSKKTSATKTPQYSSLVLPPLPLPPPSLKQHQKKNYSLPLEKEVQLSPNSPLPLHLPLPLSPQLKYFSPSKMWKMLWRREGEGERERFFSAILKINGEFLAMPLFGCLEGVRTFVWEEGEEERRGRKLGFQGELLIFYFIKINNSDIISINTLSFLISHEEILLTLHLKQ